MECVSDRLDAPPPPSRARTALSRLNFWKRRRTTAADVLRRTKAATKAHQKYTQNAEKAHDAFLDWTRGMPQTKAMPCDRTFEQGMNNNIAGHLELVLTAIEPILRAERDYNGVSSSLNVSLHVIKEQEEALMGYTRRLEGVETRLVKAAARQVRADEQQRLVSEAERLRCNVRDATVSLQQTIRRELPEKFNHYVDYWLSSAAARQNAGLNIREYLQGSEFSVRIGPHWASPDLGFEAQPEDQHEELSGMEHSTVRGLQFRDSSLGARLPNGLSENLSTKNGRPQSVLESPRASSHESPGSRSGSPGSHSGSPGSHHGSPHESVPPVTGLYTPESPSTAWAHDIMKV